LFYSSNLIIDNALVLADRWNVRQSLIGILLIGFGTSLPELSVAFSAASQKALKLTVGNLIGSNIIDLLLITGLTGTLSGINISRQLLFFDVPALFVISLTAIILFSTQKRLIKKEGLALILLFGVYVGFKLFGF
ncbi:MAG TPA: hypothetical protein VGA49_02700, partial [Patescibacteria group bacterium]